MDLIGLESRWQQGCGQPALEALGQNLFPGVFHLLEDIHIPRFMALSHVQSQQSPL